ncbi:hypothetical protein EXV95_00930 [Acidovorax sp. JMULE5]|nr:hypothetical protein EXV95_00930 [Acidovorax sp. JMULE5]
MPPCVAFGAFPRGDDTFAAGRPLLGVPGLGRASVTGSCGNPPRGCAWTGSRIVSGLRSRFGRAVVEAAAR